MAKMGKWPRQRRSQADQDDANIQDAAETLEALFGEAGPSEREYSGSMLTDAPPTVRDLVAAIINQQIDEMGLDQYGASHCQHNIRMDADCVFCNLAHSEPGLDDPVKNGEVTSIPRQDVEKIARVEYAKRRSAKTLHA